VSPPAVQLRSFSTAEFQAAQPIDLVLVGTRPECGAGPVLGDLVALRSSDGQQAWRVPAGGRVVAAPAVGYGGNQVFTVALVTTTVARMTTTKGALSAFRSNDGKLAWTASVEESLLGPTLLGDAVYTLGRNGMLRAFEQATGKLRWKLELRGRAPFRALQGRTRGHRYLVAVSGDRGVIAVREMAGDVGKVLWTQSSLPTGAAALVRPFNDAYALIESDPGPYLWVATRDGGISQLALDDIAFAPAEPLDGCGGLTFTGGSIMARRQVAGTSGVVAGAPADGTLYRTAATTFPNLKLVGTAVSASTLFVRQVAAPWACFTQAVGTAQLSPDRQSVRPARPFTLELVWTHPERWRELASLQLRLRRGRNILSWTLLDEATRTLRLERGGRRGGFTRAGEPGQRGRLSGRDTVVDLALSSQDDDGPAGRVLRYTAALRLKPGVRPGRYVVEALAADRAGVVQGFEPVGSVTVER
jgi:hypothetical protein